MTGSGPHGLVPHVIVFIKIPDKPRRNFARQGIKLFADIFPLLHLKPPVRIQIDYFISILHSQRSSIACRSPNLDTISFHSGELWGQMNL